MKNKKKSIKKDESLEVQPMKKIKINYDQKQKNLLA